MRKYLLIPVIIFCLPLNIYAGAIYLDFGTIPTTGGWNNITEHASGTTYNDLIDCSWRCTSVSYYCPNGFAGPADNGELLTIYPQTAGKDSFYVTESDTASIVIQGLKPSNAYRLTFFGSRAGSASARKIAIAIGARTLNLECSNNTSATAVFQDIFSGTNGTVEIELSAAPGSSRGYLGAVEIEGQFDITCNTPLHCLPGDFNNDCVVDLEDLTVMASMWMTHPTCFGPDCPDIVGYDGVGFDDFAVIAENWQRKKVPVLISEFMASNSNTLKDNYYESSDWIEMANVTQASINLSGWSLTDDPNDLSKWLFPSCIIAPGEHLVVYASGKNRTDPQLDLHTNFKLDADGEYLALIDSKGQVASEFAPAYPTQITDISYGLENASDAGSKLLVNEYSEADVFIPTNDSLKEDGLWTQVGFTPTAQWTGGRLGVGYDTGSNYAALYNIDVIAMRSLKSPSVYIRIPFEVDDPSGFNSLLLKMKYDDGFVAYLNGRDICRSGTVSSSDEYLSWNYFSDNNPDDDAVVYEDFHINLPAGLLRMGTNILAIHGFNDDPISDSSDILFVPELTASSTGLVYQPEKHVYFSQPTPGSVNHSGSPTLGSVITDVTENLASPADNQDIVITARVEQTHYPVADVKLYYRVMYGGETELPMYDNGSGPDAVAGDGIYTAAIPHQAASAGQMVRWRLVSKDAQDNTFKMPVFPDELKSPQYYGTVIKDSSIDSDLSVFHWFTSDYWGARGSGARGCVFYKDRFYDNVFIRRRAKSSGISLAGKPCLKFDFNPGHGFYYNDDIPSAGEINLNNNKYDKSLITQILGMRTFALAGSPHSICDAFHVRLNGSFFAIQIFVEHPEDDYLRRNDLDDNGALYKGLQSPWNDLQDGIVLGGIGKRTRLYEGYDDIIAFGEGVRAYEGLAGQSSLVPLLQRSLYVHDNVDIAAVVNYTACMSIIHGNDHHAKNYYLYCDTEGTGLWRFLPWDLDLSFGHNFANTSNNNMYAVELPGGHPLWGCSDYPRQSGADHWNGLIDIIMDVPHLRQMHLRRLRTLMDEIFQSPNTPRQQYQYETFMDDFKTKIASTVPLEAADWTDDYTYGGATYYPAEQIGRIESLFLVPRRNHLFNVHNIDNYTGDVDNCAGIPHSQSAGLMIDFGAIEVSPPSGNQDQEYVQLINNNAEAVDISNWTLAGGIEHTFTPGTVIPAGMSLYVSPGVKDFKLRESYPKGGQGLFVQGNYKGHLSSWGETIELRDAAGTLNNSMTTPVSPSSAQRYLRITEIMYHPAPGGDYNEEEYEFIEFTNIGTSTLDLQSIRLIDGVDFTFPSGRSLASGDYILVVKNQAAFESRYGTGHNIAGQYVGSLSNKGEKITLNDPTRGTILSFEYNDSWYQVTDGKGFSLVISDPHSSDLDSWNDRTSWRPAASDGGSPGTADTPDVPAPGSVIVNEVLAHTDLAPQDWIELHNTTAADINIGGWFLSDTDTDLLKYEIPAGYVVPAEGYMVFTQDDHFGSDFALSENGETVYLTSGYDGVLTGYSESQGFGPSLVGVAFGIYEKSDGGRDFTAMSTNTPGLPNAYPQAGPVIIRQIMYNPSDFGSLDNDEYEYIELYNTASSSVNLYESNLTGDIPWRFTNGIDYTFPLNTTLAPYASLYVVRNSDAFRDRYPSVDDAKIYGPYTGKLDNGGEKIQLSRPGDEIQDEPGNYYDIRVEMVNYSDGAHPAGSDPWPSDPDGNGASLVRTSDTGYSNDVINWQASYTAQPH